ncbi:hypothetical protein H5S09_03380 [Limosilactobacillus sp. STM2_1]|uniref:Uncharacterized protein n=1 Tax=Limosilactobacillus rudii TaxID=2759755 RepID=A0A7W3ULC2_9LACO|nr:hypothetical protein [Limosilactobacillus rudii]MBB1079130.1 hypothetical protein [Limosilactobacillus rudii]MBB1096995.1 hypothetical protein [Limosilactobacillus rudii]MCD7133963.1 hypothetical protein [Limosilactobacillus rudii]
MRGDYRGKHGDTRRDRRFFSVLRLKWTNMSQIDRIINGALGIVILALLVSVVILFSQHNNSSTKNVASSHSNMSMSASKKRNHQSSFKENDDSRVVSDTMESKTNQEAEENISNDDSSTLASESDKNKGRVNHGEVSEGMDAEYRMARQAGIVTGDWSTESIHDFYNNVQDNNDGSFTYNGKTVYVQKTYQGNPNGIEYNGSTYTDPDRYTVTTDQ